MLNVQVKAKRDRDPRVLAELIAAHQGEAASSEVETHAKIVRDHQAEDAKSRPSWQELDTVNFGKLDDDNDWSDL